MATPAPNPLNRFHEIPATQTASVTMTSGEKCYDIPLKGLGDLACQVLKAIPSGCALSQVALTEAIVKLGFNRSVANTLALVMLSGCCPLGIVGGPKCGPHETYDPTTGKCVDPPIPMDYIDESFGGYLLPSPHRAGSPTPTVGGCNCTHETFEEESNFTSTGNVGLIRS